ncbi:hypothetical protein CHS0354_041780 [Potamilus streckersoni]|uniref:SUN domain-containing protein n=1 Tax=Potamilus streckersoni TaxID=2493646 RepID=A0AAE0T134_9BIVA|nr:hypothetical protein CHS0354_041780 [Potamilus streckersoni]
MFRKASEVGFVYNRYRSPGTTIKERKTVQTSFVSRSLSFSSSSDSFLEDEEFDIKPKTEYTYAKSGSYSPRFLGRKYVKPNMSRRRIHVLNTSSYTDKEEDERFVEMSDSSDEGSYDYYTYKAVPDRGMVLRSGSRLKSVRSVLEGHVAEHDSVASNTITSTNAMLISNRNFNSNIADSNYNSNINNSASKKDLTASESHSKSNQSSRTSVSSRSQRSVRKTLIGDFDGADNSNTVDNVQESSSVRRTSSREDIEEEEVEKGSLETSANKERSAMKSSSQIKHMYGLDSEGEFSDSSSSEKKSRGISRSGSAETVATKTVITTVIETITRITKPVTDPFWRTIGQPVWEKVVKRILVVVGLDVWLLKRGGARWCCMLLPLLLLIPLFFIIGFGPVQRVFAIPVFFTSESKSESLSVENVENLGYVSLREDVRRILLQLQESNRQHLQLSDIEMMINTTLQKELDKIKASQTEYQYTQKQEQLNFEGDQSRSFDSIRRQIMNITAEIKKLQINLNLQKDDIQSQSGILKADIASHVNDLEKKIEALTLDLSQLDKSNQALLLTVKNCCHEDSFYVKTVHDQVDTILAQMMEGHTTGKVQDAFSAWLHAHYVSREALDARLKILANELTDQIMDVMKQSKTEETQVYIASNNTGISEQYVKIIIEDALQKYSADKTGLADFALESAGGSVISTRCSETYYKKTALISVFGIPLWYSSNSPRTVIQPEVHPGECWAFRGSQGYIVIQLSTAIVPTGFTLEHIPKSLSPTGNIDSAPRDFTVFGLQDEIKEGVNLGNFSYNQDGKPMQFFPVQIKDSPHFRLVELQILNNHGNLEYTCLYRFRVHGKPYRPLT